MLSWKTLPLLVAAAVAMNGVAAIEQGYGGGVKLPSSTTATPSDESPVQSTLTGSSVDASSAVDQSSSETSYPSDTSTALPSGSGSDNLST
ncbi:hypothetical protein PF005_g25487, partial [Phytophthora fragariae]